MSKTSSSSKDSNSRGSSGRDSGGGGSSSGGSSSGGRQQQQRREAAVKAAASEAPAGRIRTGVKLTVKDVILKNDVCVVVVRAFEQTIEYRTPFG